MKKLIFTLLLILSLTGCSSINDQVDNDIAQNVDDVNNQTVQVSKDEMPTKPTGSKLKAIDCKSEQRNMDGCIEIYQPVCGQAGDADDGTYDRRKHHA